MISSTTLTTDQLATIRPLPGRIVLEIEPNPSTVNGIIIPEVARDKSVHQITQIARVVTTGYGPFHERDTDTRKLKRYAGIDRQDLVPGDRVLFRPLVSEMNARFVLTDSRRVDAVLE